MIQAITFDLDGVYFPNGKANFIRALAELGVAEAEAKRVFMESDEMNQRYKLGTMTDHEFWAWAAEQWHLDKPPEALMGLLVSSYDVDENVAVTVRAVRKHGYKTLVCSSNFPARVNGLQRRFGFLDDFDAAVFSYEVGVPKPSAQLFAELIRRADAPASAIVFADDHEVNVSAATESGLTAFIYEGFDAFVAKLHSLGVAW